MTRYEQGFMNTCAEYGLDENQSAELMYKQAQLAGFISRMATKFGPAAYKLLTRSARGAGKLSRQLINAGRVNGGILGKIQQGTGNLFGNVSGMASKLRGNWVNWMDNPGVLKGLKP